LTLVAKDPCALRPAIGQVAERYLTPVTWLHPYYKGSRGRLFCCLGNFARLPVGAQLDRVDQRVHFHFVAAIQRGIEEIRAQQVSVPLSTAVRPFRA
jgi:hypothetical protein